MFIAYLFLNGKSLQKATPSTTIKPTYNTVLPLGTSTTTYPPVTSILIDPSLPPTSLVPPSSGYQVFSAQPSYSAEPSYSVQPSYSAKPSIATTQASVVTTTGAIIIPKGGIPNGPVTASYSDLTPAIIILQPQQSQVCCGQSIHVRMGKNIYALLHFTSNDWYLGTCKILS